MVFWLYVVSKLEKLPLNLSGWHPVIKVSCYYSESERGPRTRTRTDILEAARRMANSLSKYNLALYLELWTTRTSSMHYSSMTARRATLGVTRDSHPRTQVIGRGCRLYPHRPTSPLDTTGESVLTPIGGTSNADEFLAEPSDGQYRQNIVSFHRRIHVYTETLA